MQEARCKKNQAPLSRGLMISVAAKDDGGFGTRRATVRWSRDD